MKFYLATTLFIHSLLSPTLGANAAEPLFDMEAIRDVSTLEVEVIEDWHLVKGRTPSRQKLITIKVGEIWPGQDYRMPVRFVVPVEGKANGFHLTGGNQPQRLKQDTRVSNVDAILLERGIGQVQTIVQVLQASGLGELGKESEERFAKSLNPRDKIQYWAWPATMMRAITAAHAETDHFNPGKVAMSGGSKNGATPSLAILHDERMTGVFATVSPIWDSPLRLCDRAAWDSLEADYGPMTHSFLGGHYGPVFNRQALEAGRSWEDLQRFTAAVSDGVFISRNLEALLSREVDLFFEPGSHDFVAFDLAWGGAHYPDIPLYVGANTGHGIKDRHPGIERDANNRTAFLLNHFFDEVTPMLPVPNIATDIGNGILSVHTSFPQEESAESARLFWIVNRPSDGSPGYIKELIPHENWSEMEFRDGAWQASIPLPSDATHIDVFANHEKTISYRGTHLSTWISTPYTRVILK